MFFCARHITFWGKSFRMHQQWNCQSNLLTTTVATLFSFLAVYILPGTSRQKQDTANQCTFPTLRICSRQTIWKKNSSRVAALIFSNTDGWRYRQQMAPCSAVALASSTAYNELFTWSSFLNNLLLLSACVSSSLRYFVGLGRLRSFIW